MLGKFNVSYVMALIFLITCMMDVYRGNSSHPTLQQALCTGFHKVVSLFISMQQATNHVNVYMMSSDPASAITMLAW
jgi:hypothetical protein